MPLQLLRYNATVIWIKYNIISILYIICVTVITLIVIRSTNISMRNEEENIYAEIEMNRQESRICGADSVVVEKDVAYESVGF